jgi:hypothetical protein
MSDVPRLDLTIIQGATFRRTVNWYGAGILCKAIESVTVGCPTVIGITSHGLPSVSTTPVFIHDVVGAYNLNTGKKTAIATYLTADSFSVNLSTNNQEWEADTGSVTFYAPTDLTGYTARMQIRITRGSTVTVHELTTENGGITLNAADGGINLLISDTDTAAFDFDNAVYDLELINTAGNGDVTRVAEGIVKLHKEVTR